MGKDKNKYLNGKSEDFTLASFEIERMFFLIYPLSNSKNRPIFASMLSVGDTKSKEVLKLCKNHTNTEAAKTMVPAFKIKDLTCSQVCFKTVFKPGI